MFWSSSACRDCGRPLSGRGPRCSDCYRAFRSRQFSRNWHEPERLEGQEARDRELGRTAFFVYVLATHYGHYVGHTSNVNARVRWHQANEVPSTSGGNPALMWRSRPLHSREDAARFEAAMKSWRDSGSPRYRETTGFDPIPFSDLRSRRQQAGSVASRGGCLALPVLGLAALALALAVLIG